MTDAVVVGSVLYHADKAVCQWVSERVPIMAGRQPNELYAALGIVARGQMAAGIIFHNYRPTAKDMEITVAAESALWCRPKVLTRLFTYPFHQIGVKRITCMTSRSNKRCRRLIEGLGWKLEGVVRKAFDGREDLFVYGMLKSECRFLKGEAHV